MNAGTKPLIGELLPRWILSYVTVWGVLACSGCEKAPNPSAAPKSPQANTAPPASTAQQASTAPPANNAKAVENSPKDKPAPGNSAVVPVPDPGKAPAVTTTEPALPVDATPRQLLERMVKAYSSAKGYADHGFIVQRYFINGQPYEQRQQLSIAYEKPGKLRLDCYNIKLLNDGKLVHGIIRDKDGILELASPATLTQENAIIDETMQNELSRGFGGDPLQLLLLFAADPLSVILGEQPASFLPDLMHQGFNCRRLKITTPAGDLVLWIDTREFVVRRLDYPLNELKKELAKQGEIKQLEQYADFVGAELNPKFSPETFKFEVPAGALLVKRFLPMPAPLRPTILLGKLSPEFEFKTAKGDKVTPDSLQGKVAVLVFWGSQYQPCGAALPLVQQVYDYYRDNKEVEFYAVSIDEANTDQSTLDAAFKAWNVSLPIVRDPKADANKSLGVDGIPSLLVIGKKGLIENHWQRLDNTLPQALPNIINALLAGESTHAATLRDYEQRLAEYQRWQQTPPNETIASRNMPLATATIAPASAPQKHVLQAAWSLDAEQVKQPGNVLVVPGTEPGATRLMVLDGWNAVVEVDQSGKVLARHELNLPPKTAVTALRSAVDHAGKRTFVLFHPYDERGQLYVFDNEWKQVLVYPRQEDLGEDRISDVQIGDVTGDGSLKLVVGYSGSTGLQMVNLAGERVWRNREQVRMSLRMALSEPREGGARLIFCPNEQGTVIPLNDRGEAQPPWQIPGQRMIGLYSSNDETPPAAARPSSLAGLLPMSDTRVNVVGLNEMGRLLWNYELPQGLHGFPIEQVQSVRLGSEPNRSWLLAGADGSVHLLDERGQLLDRFNTGNALRGVAATHRDGKPLLITVGKDGVKAETLLPKETATLEKPEETK